LRGNKFGKQRSSSHLTGEHDGVDVHTIFAGLPHDVGNGGQPGVNQFARQHFEFCTDDPYRNALGGQTNLNERGCVLEQGLPRSPATGCDLPHNGPVGGIVCDGEITAHLLEDVPGQCPVQCGGAEIICSRSRCQPACVVLGTGHQRHFCAVGADVGHDHRLGVTHRLRSHRGRNSRDWDTHQ
jgi:hypothetical protein